MKCITVHCALHALHALYALLALHELHALHALHALQELHALHELHALNYLCALCSFRVGNIQRERVLSTISTVYLNIKSNKHNKIIWRAFSLKKFNCGLYDSQLDVGNCQIETFTT